MPANRRPPLLVDLALQGGGAHGAFTWGVLDRLIEEPWLKIDGISGTSAGAMNAAVMASGWEHGGVEGAKAALEGFWKAVSDAGRFSPLQRGPLALLSGRWTLENSPMYMATELMTRMFSPYELNPLNAHPLRDILADTVDFGALAVGNPTITPLVRECKSQDTILVQINPIVREGVPKTARDIMNRLNEVSFNSPLVKELRMIALLNKVADPGRGEGALWAGMRIHRIASDRVTEVDSTSKLITEWRFLCGLRDEGRRVAGLFLEEQGDHLGKRSTLDLDAMLAAC